VTFHELKCTIAIEAVRQILNAIEVPPILVGECPHCAAIDILAGAYLAGIVEHRQEGETFEQLETRLLAEFASHLTEVINEARNDQASHPVPTHPGTGTPQ